MLLFVVLCGAPQQIEVFFLKLYKKPSPFFFFANLFLLAPTHDAESGMF